MNEHQTENHRFSRSPEKQPDPNLSQTPPPAVSFFSLREKAEEGEKVGLVPRAPDVPRGQPAGRQQLPLQRRDELLGQGHRVAASTGARERDPKPTNRGVGREGFGDLLLGRTVIGLHTLKGVSLFSKTPVCGLFGGRKACITLKELVGACPSFVPGHQVSCPRPRAACEINRTRQAVLQQMQQVQVEADLPSYNTLSPSGDWKRSLELCDLRFRAGVCFSRRAFGSMDGAC